MIGVSLGMHPFPPALGARIAAYRESILTAPYEISIERARLVTAAYRETVGEHPSIRAARAFERALAGSSITIRDFERIAGNPTNKLVGTSLPVERGDMNLILELEIDHLTKRRRQPFRIDPGDREELFREILPYWRSRSLRARKKELWRENGIGIGVRFSPASLYDRARSLDRRAMARVIAPRSMSPWRWPRAIAEIAYDNPAMVMNVFDMQGHMVLGHRNVLADGFSGIAERARERLRRCKEEGDTEGEAFCRGVLISCEAIHRYADRYCALARAMADEERNPERRAGLLAIAGRCARVPYLPPRDFREAVQAVWLTQVGANVAYGMGGIFGVGRIDQYLYPYYRADLEAGRLSREEALETIEELLVKLASALLLVPAAGKNTGSELGAESQNVTVGGVDRQGRDATNDLSHLFLDAVAGLRSMANSFSIRVSEKSPPEWLRRVAETYAVTSGPAVFNDEAVVPSLAGCGYSIEDARDYALIGCVEPTGDGDTFGCTSGNDISLTGALEMALFRGRLWIVGGRVGPDTGDPRTFATFDDLMEAMRRQVSFMVDLVARGTDLKDRAYAEGFHNPYVSSTLAGCIEKARDMTRGGARYDFRSISARGLGTAADSLAAMKRLVYEEKTVTMGEMIEALRTNFRGRETLRQMLLRKAPKFGSDDDEADGIARDVAEHFCREVARRRGLGGARYRPSFFSYGMHVLEGALLGASPNGRRAGEPVSNSLSPANGSERKGPTAVLRSLAKIDQRLISNGCALNMKLLPAFLATAEGREKIVHLIRAYFGMGGMEVQLNVVDRETLLDAQVHPERHLGLVVRVSGYCAYFTDLGRAIQDEIIARTAFEGC